MLSRFCYPYARLSDASDHSVRTENLERSPFSQVGASTNSPLEDLRLDPNSAGPHDNHVLFSSLLMAVLAPAVTLPSMQQVLHYLSGKDAAVSPDFPQGS